MSVRWMSEVWKCSALHDSRKVLVALALADWANDEGLCWPSIPMIAEKSRVSRASVFRYLKEFESLGLATRESGGGKGKTTCYRLNFVVAEIRFSLTETVSDSDTVSNQQTVSPAKQTVSNRGPNGLKSTSAIRKNHHEPSLLQPPIALPDWLPREVWDNFKAHRAANRKRHGPLTDRAERIALKALTKLRDKGYDPVEIVERTIVSGWASFFEPYPQNGKPQPRGGGFLDINELNRRRGVSHVPDNSKAGR